MPRLMPDSNDLAVWKCDSPPPFVNSTPSTDPGIAGPLDTAQVFAYNGSTDPIFMAPGPYGRGSKSVMFCGSSNKTCVYGARTFEPQPPFTISFWIKLYKYDVGTYSHRFVSKQRPYDVGTYTSAVVISNSKASSDPEGLEFTVWNGSAFTPYPKSSRAKAIPLGVWSHVGASLSTTEAKMYVNGVLVASETTGGSFSVNYDAHGPWFVGSMPWSSDTIPSCYSIADVRIANVVRPQSWFEEMYSTAMLERIPVP